MQSFIIDQSYKIIDGSAVISLFGRMVDGSSFQAKFTRKPYFYIRTSDTKYLEDLKDMPKFEIKKTTSKDFIGKKVSKVVIDIPKDVPEFRKSLADKGIPTFEADIRFVQRFLIDNDIRGALDIEGDFEKGDRIDRIYEEPRISPSEFSPGLKVISIDIETNRNASRIFSISMYSQGYSKVLIQKKEKVKGAENYATEKEMLETFKKYIIEFDPDIITGWNLVDFDLDVLKKRFMANGIRFDVSRTGEPCRIRKYSSFFRDSTATLPGRMVLDGMALMKASFIRLEDYKLSTAAHEILGEEKTIEFKKDKAKEIEEIFEKDPELLVKYNLKDSVLVYDILEKKGLIELTIQRSLLTGMPLDMVKASIASLDSLYIRETRKRSIVCPNSQYNEREERIKGGYVRQSKPGIYDDVVVLDFKSLYPSIIRTFNIDPLMHVQDTKKKKDLIISPNGAAFRKEEGILPQLIQGLWQKRDQAKKREDNEASYAIKITMNSFFGVLANPMCRFYSLDMANAITSFGRKIVKETADLAEKSGLEVIYGDTDSIFVITHEKDLKSAEKKGNLLATEINKHWERFAEENFGRKSFLELQFEKSYSRFLMPMVRGSSQGAKKRYAGLMIKDGREQIDFTGLEFVRRDWTELSKVFQLELLDRIFHKKEVTGYIKDFVKDIRRGKKDDLLIYKKAIRKDLSKYTKTTPPHVKAARKLSKLDSSIIEYVITTDGPEPLQNLKHKIDYEHYIDKQVKPIADSILVFYDTCFDDLLKGSSQTSLFSY